ncbi:MAG: PH domain-containing protein [Syntrophales bacterium]|nr:PH domain-containing protein [Syntrophales bacterium]
MKKTGYGRFNPQAQLRLRSGLEMQREMEMPSDIEGEDVIMAGQASYQDGMVTRANWKPGYLYLTKERLIFLQGANKLFEISLSSLKDISIIQRNWVPKKKVEQLQLIQQSDSFKRVFFLFAGNLEEWKKAIELSKKEEGKDG